MSAGEPPVPAAPASILVLDDEEAQRLSVRVQLAGLGVFADFDDPRAALSFLQTRSVDAIVVDIRMPHLPVDGLWFLAKLREIDREVGVILRTADEDIAIADAAIEARAVQRVIKSQPHATSRLRDAVRRAVDETRARRTVLATAARAEETRRELAAVLNRARADATVAAMCRGFVAGLVNQASAANGYAELLDERVGATSDSELARLGARSRQAVNRLAEEIGSFLEDPHLNQLQGTESTVNACIAALERIFRHHPLFVPGGCWLAIRGTQPDASFAANPLRTLVALRHLIEYCARHSGPAGTVSVSVAQEPAGRTPAATQRAWVLNAADPAARWAAAIVVQARLDGFEPSRLESALRSSSAAPVAGDLAMLAQAVLEDRLALRVSATPHHLAVFELFLPQVRLS